MTFSGINGMEWQFFDDRSIFIMRRSEDSNQTTVRVFNSVKAKLL